VLISRQHYALDLETHLSTTLSLEYLYRAVRTARGNEVARLVVRDRVDGLPHLRSMHLRTSSRAVSSFVS
jgi:hypothetical protein